jgi:hypothetical protein
VFGVASPVEAAVRFELTLLAKFVFRSLTIKLSSAARLPRQTEPGRIVELNVYWWQMDDTWLRRWDSNPQTSGYEPAM